jgi:hypothetical protein
MNQQIDLKLIEPAAWIQVRRESKMQRSRMAWLAAALLCIFTAQAAAQVDRGGSRVRAGSNPATQDGPAAPAPAAVAAPQITTGDDGESALRQSLTRIAGGAERAPPVFRSRSAEERSALAARLGARISSRLTPFVLTPNEGYVPGRGEIDIGLPTGFSPRHNHIIFREGRGSLLIMLSAEANSRMIVDCDIETGGAAMRLYMTDSNGTWTRRIDEPVVNGRLSVLLPATTSDFIGFHLSWPYEQPVSGLAFWTFRGCEITPVEAP